MSKQKLVLSIINRGIKLHTVKGIQCVKYQQLRPYLSTEVKFVYDNNKTTSIGSSVKGSNKNAILWDTVNRVKYLRLDWLFDMVSNNQLFI